MRESQRDVALTSSWPVASRSAVCARSWPSSAESSVSSALARPFCKVAMLMFDELPVAYFLFSISRLSFASVRAFDAAVTCSSAARWLRRADRTSFQIAWMRCSRFAILISCWIFPSSIAVLLARCIGVQVRFKLRPQPVAR